MSSMTSPRWPLGGRFRFHVPAGGRLDRLVSGIPWFLRGGDGVAGVLRQPLAPLRPPAALDFLRRGECFFGIRWQRLEDPVAAPLLVRRVDDAGDMPAGA